MGSEVNAVSIIQNVLPGLEIELQRVKELLNELEEDEFNQLRDEADPLFERDSILASFTSRMQRTSRLVLMCLDAAGMRATRDDFQKAWVGFDLADTKYIHDLDVLHSEPYSYLTDMIDGLRLIATGGESPTAQVDLQRLKDVLEATAVLMRKRGIEPEREHDIQQVMADYLAACFPREFIPSPGVPGFIKKFKADTGIRHLKAAVEFKFASNATELKEAVSGIFEDTAGYKGSLDWTRFYSVIYMTEAFEAPARFHADMTRAGAVNWTVIPVTGAGEKQRRTRKGKVEQGELKQAEQDEPKKE